jgi:hypothetical protein
MLLAVKAMGGENSDAWRSVLDDLIGRGLCRPDLPDHCPQTRRYLSETTFAVQKPPPAAAAIRPYRCTINMYLIRMLAGRRRHRQNGP